VGFSFEYVYFGMLSAGPGGDTTPALSGVFREWAARGASSVPFLHITRASSLVIAINFFSFTRPPLPRVHSSGDIDIDRILGLIHLIIRLMIKRHQRHRDLAGSTA
jgi:hypothetical protein